MKFFISAIGSGNTLNYPHQRDYDGVLALLESSPDCGFKYKCDDNLQQDNIFDLKFKNTTYLFKDWFEINTAESTYEIGKEIIGRIDDVKKDFPHVRFHVETSAGYKRIGYILSLISYIREDIYKLTFMNHKEEVETLPIIEIKLHTKEKEIFKEFIESIPLNWNNKISSNPFVREYNKDRKYIYRVLSKCKGLGLLAEDNLPTDFGRLYIEFC